MTKVDVSTTARDSVSTRVCFVAEDGNHLPEEIPAEEFAGGRLTTLLLHGKGTHTLYVGLGKSESVTPEIVRRAGGMAALQLLKIGIEDIALDLDTWMAHAGAAVEGVLIGSYRFETYKPAEARRKNKLECLTVLAEGADLATVEAALETGRILAESVNYTRDLGNRPPNDFTPVAVAEEAVALAKEHRLTCRVWDEKKLRREGFDGILAVGNGSVNESRFIVLEYRGAAKTETPVVLVGKAITFDTGGICLKPREGMEEMKWDKMGGMTVLGAMRAIAELKVEANVIGVIAAAENMLGAAAWRPGDIISTYGGKTIEVLNTDAEGRVVLADALAWSNEHLSPRAKIDFATLTGACVVALGDSQAGLFTEDDTMAAALQSAAEATGEALWRLPMGEDYDEMIKSDVAAAKNVGPRWGGASSAAAFLKVWAGPEMWAHVDIAGTGWTSKGKPWLEKGASGYGVRLAVEAVRRLA